MKTHTECTVMLSSTGTSDRRGWEMVCWCRQHGEGWDSCQLLSEHTARLLGALLLLHLHFAICFCHFLFFLIVRLLLAVWFIRFVPVSDLSVMLCTLQRHVALFFYFNVFHQSCCTIQRLDHCLGFKYIQSVGFITGIIKVNDTC